MRIFYQLSQVWRWPLSLQATYLDLEAFVLDVPTIDEGHIMTKIFYNIGYKGGYLTAGFRQTSDQNTVQQIVSCSFSVDLFSHWCSQKPSALESGCT